MQPGGRIKLRHIEFATEYLANGGDATAAYLAVYPNASRRSAYSLGAKLLQHADVVGLIDGAETQAMNKLEITAERIIRELACMAFVDAAELYDEHGNLRRLSEIPEEARRAIVSIDPPTEHSGPKAKTEGKRGALQLLGQTLALFAEKKIIDETSEQTHRVLVSEVDLEERIKNITGEGSDDLGYDPFA